MNIDVSKLNSDVSNLKVMFPSSLLTLEPSLAVQDQPKSYSFFSVNTTSMLEKLIAAVSNVIQQLIPNIINQQQVLNLSKPKQAAVEPEQSSSIRLEKVLSANQNSFFLSAFSSNVLCCQNELLVGNFTNKKFHENSWEKLYKYLFVCKNVLIYWINLRKS